MHYQFGDIDIDIDKQNFEVHRGGKPVPIEPLVFDLLVHFVENPDRVISRDELIEHVWNGRMVSDSTVAGAIKTLRKVIGDSGETQKYLKTIHSRGFRFTANNSGTASVADAADHKSSLIVCDPVLLLLPAPASRTHRETTTLLANLVQDLERILTRIPLLRISAQADRYSGNDPRPAPRQIHDDIGAHFILDVSLRPQRDAMGVYVQLTDARAGFRLWSEQFNRSLHGDDSEEQLVISIIARLEPELNRAIYELVKQSDTKPNARQLYLQASGLLALKGWHEDTFTEATDLLRQSIAQDDSLAQAWAYLSLLLGFGHRIGLILERTKTIAEVESSGARALELDNLDSTVLGFVGCALCDIGQPARGTPILKNAISRNPANGQAWVALGAAYLAQNNIPAAVEHLDHGIRISPLDSRLSVWGAMLALAYLQAGDFQQAIHTAEMASAHDHNTYLPRLVLAAIHLRENDIMAARAAMQDTYRIKPNLSDASIVSVLGVDVLPALRALA